MLAPLGDFGPGVGDFGPAFGHLWAISGPGWAISGRLRALSRETPNTRNIHSVECLCRASCSTRFLVGWPGGRFHERWNVRVWQQCFLSRRLLLGGNTASTGIIITRNACRSQFCSSALIIDSTRSVIYGRTPFPESVSPTQILM